MTAISDYFLIGDLHTAALVSNKGSVDWLCLPHFDSGSVFAKMLDEKGGSFTIQAEGYDVRASYIPNTAIVEFIFSNEHGSFRLRDFMVPKPYAKIHAHALVRKIEALKGEHDITFIYDPKPNYALDEPEFTELKRVIKVETGKQDMYLHLPKKVKYTRERDGYLIKFKVSEGETKAVILEHIDGQRDHKKRDFEAKTMKFWEKWVAKGKFVSFCRDKMIRSAITLKLMQYFPSGAMIAAPTTSLPESVGGDRNWDYRYVWIRDATFALYAFYVLGYHEEAKKFFHYIEGIAKECEECNTHVHLMYTIDGEAVPGEKHLSHFAGYKGSKPVRIGNEAVQQFQLDVYGALIDSYYFMLLHKEFKLSKHSKHVIVDLIEQIIKRWQEKDSGIWEFREKKEHFTYSKVMSWVGINRAIRICNRLGIMKEKKKELEKIEQQMLKWIWDYCFDDERNVLKQHPGTKHQDATNFLFVLVQFLHKRDPLTKTIIQNTRRELVEDDIFVYRYKTKDAFKGEEGAFNLCLYWLISSLAILEEVDEAERLFKMFEGLMNPQGLLSEEIDKETRGYLGNYPQSFSHMGYIASAHYIDKYRKRKSKS